MRRDRIDKVIAQNRNGFDAFDYGSLGDATLEMIPFVIFRVLQELEPSTFGDAALNSYGFFPRTDTPSRHNGLAWTRPASSGSAFEVRYMTRTCAGCHTGRVQLSDGTMRILNGGVNTEMNAHRFIGQLTSALKIALSTSNDSADYKTFRNQVLAVIASKPAEWFWGANSELIPPSAAAKEVGIVVSNIDDILSTMRKMNDRRLSGLSLVQKHSYNNYPNPPNLTAGAPGLVETSGLGSASLVPKMGIEKIALLLPPGPAMADIPAVWGIDPGGYANWDATLKGFARSLTSSMAVVGNPAKIDLQQNLLIQAFLPKLPPEPYPFAIDLASRARGAATYRKNCSGCHDGLPGKSRNSVIFDVDTDPLRANAITPMTAEVMSKAIKDICPETQPECRFKMGEIVVDPSSKRGYVASPLRGIWAQAPYLHNGSIPTLRQLLVPRLRINSPFLRGSISYNEKDGGWESDPAKEENLRKLGQSAVAIHDIRQAGFSNAGHGSVKKPFIFDGRGAKVRIAWSDSDRDTRVVDDLISYLLSL
ncbi:MAG: hypothetical protein IPJ12_07915 [Betaproteobacteria bacterium]|nr:hypothetical protein [Betaproteobacteria bacterium]